MNRKQRMVSFRLTEDQYNRMQGLRGNYGARTVSELARLAVDTLMYETKPIVRVNPAILSKQKTRGPLLERLQAVESSLSSMQTELNRLQTVLQTKTSCDNIFRTSTDLMGPASPGEPGPE